MKISVSTREHTDPSEKQNQFYTLKTPSPDGKFRYRKGDAKLGSKHLSLEGEESMVTCYLQKAKVISL